MTVRQWYRIQRKAIWDRGDLFQSGIEHVATIAVDRLPIPQRLMVGDVWLIFDLSQYESEQAIHADIVAAMRRDRMRILSKADLTK